MLAERSPIHKVENIKKPMLIFHGANDVRSKVAESDTIVAAMQEKNIPVTYVVYPDEGHGFAKPSNRLSYIAMAEAFFARHLGGAFEPVTSLKSSCGFFGMAIWTVRPARRQRVPQWWIAVVEAVLFSPRMVRARVPSRTGKCAIAPALPPSVAQKAITIQNQERSRRSGLAGDLC